MGLIAIVGFVAWCLAALASPPAALNLLILLFSTEQILQASVSTLRNSPAGLQLTNFVVAGTIGLAATIAVTRRADLLRGSMSPCQVAVLTLYAWTIVSCSWSPGAEAGFEVLHSQWPYFLLMFIVAPLLIGDVRDLARAWRMLLLVALIQASFILLSPEFKLVDGRLGVSLGGNWRSNPLVIGEVGGYCMILGALAGSGGRSRWSILVRLTAIGIGVMTAILSGSRGQFLFAIAALLVGLPLSRPNLDARRYFTGVVSAAVLVPIILWIASSVIESGDSSMLKRWSSESSDDGTQGRAANALALLTAYLGSPAYWLQGLGFYAFNAMNSHGEPYTHVLFADIVGEEGLVGIALFAVIIWSATGAAKDLWRCSRGSTEDRRAIATLITLIVYQMLLVNKQGNIAQSFVFFGLILIMCRLARRLEQGPDSLAELRDQRTSSFPGWA
jgi:hypothetical protein